MILPKFKGFQPPEYRRNDQVSTQKITTSKIKDRPTKHGLSVPENAKFDQKQHFPDSCI